MESEKRIKYKGIEMIEVELKKSESFSEEGAIFITPSTIKPIKVTLQDPPCPVFDDILCEYSEIVEKGTGICFRCNNFENCPVINN